MKTRLLFLIMLVFGFTTMTQAQSNTMVFLEEGTQASCPPCATQNPPYNAMIAANSDKVIAIAYQVWWPGFDPMYLDNESDVNDRVAYYNITGVPTAFQNGEVLANDCGAYDGAPSCLDEDDINATYDMISPFTMTLEASAQNTMLTVTGSVYADAAQSGDLRLRVALNEKLITIEDAPGGTNGETEYHHVMKKFLGDGTGGTMLDDFMMGDQYDFEFTLDLATVNIYNYDQLEVVAWVQDDSDKTVYQAAKDGSVEFTVDYNSNASLPVMGELPGSVCPGTATISPVVRLFNTGADDLTSCDIVYSVNGGTEQTYNWEGSLSTFAAEWVTLDPITFEAVDGNNTIDAMASMPNGMTDEDMSDNDISGIMPPAPATVQHLEINISTDIYADETYWEVRSSGGDVVAWGGNPNVGTDNINTGVFPPDPDPAMYQNSSNYQIFVTLPEGDDCYTFHITDYYGDGIFAPGGYSISDSDGNVLVEDFANESYTAEVMHDFTATSTGVSIDDTELALQFTVSPNPANDIVNVFVTSMVESGVTFEIVNTQGQLVKSAFYSNMGNEFNTQFDVSDLASGMYFLNLRHENGVESTKFMIRK